MALVTAVANTKGGSGKSTLAVNLAVESSRYGRRVLLVDADTQGSSAHFVAVRDRNTDRLQAVQLTEPIIHTQIEALAEPFDLVYIDAGGRDSPVFRSALLAADRVLVPLVPSAFDAWASDTLFAVLDELSLSGDLEILVALVQVTHTVVAREALEQIRAYLEEHNAKLLESVIFNRTAWPRATGEGLAVTEWRPSGKAAAELRELATELGVSE